MATITLTDSEYDEIRLLIDNNIDDESLPDARIDGGTVLGAAESYMRRRIPGGTSELNTDETKSYRRAVLYRCAWILVPSFPAQTAETTGPFASRHEAATVETRQAVLQSQVDEDIQKLVDAGHGVSVDEFMPAIEVFRPGG